jgi:pyruvate ferredoxin oxidoreductase beta subunit
MGIVAAHHIKYAATANIGFLDDFKAKVKKAFETKGPSFILVFSPCPNQWKFQAHKTIDIGKLAAETNFWPLYEIINGEYKINYKPKTKKRIENFLETQGRFKHIFKNSNKKELLKKIQEQVDNNWERIEDLEETGVRV